MFIRRFLEGTAYFLNPEEETGTEEQTAETTEESAAATTEESPATTEQRADWRDKQIDRQHRMIKDRDRQLAEAQAENERLRELAERVASQQSTTTEDTTTRAASAQTTEQIQREAERIANARFAQDTYNRDCNDAFNKGKKSYGDKWEPALKTLGQFPEIANSQEVMQQILRTDDPAKVLYELGNNPEETQRILELPESRRQTELIKIAIKEEKVQQSKPSNAPPPVETLNGRGGPAKSDDLYDDKMSDEDFYAIRAKQKKERFAARGR